MGRIGGGGDDGGEGDGPRSGGGEGDDRDGGIGGGGEGEDLFAKLTA